MKICVTSQGRDLLAQVDPRFGRCQYFIIVDPDTLEFEAIQNPNVAAASGAGIQSAQLMADKGIEVLLTGNIGPNAFNTLQAAGIKIITGVTGTIQEAIESFKKGGLQEGTGPTVAGKFGLGSGQTQADFTPQQPLGPGFSLGMGPGMGWQQPMLGWQQPMPGWQQPMPGWQQPMPGWQQPMPSWQQPMPQMPPQMSKEQELQMLKSYLEFLRQQVDWINRRIDELSKE
jgi:predicted Fe-Mo cluster-binding NifX family protein